MLSRRTSVRPHPLPSCTRTNPPLVAAEKYIGPLAVNSIKTVVREVTEQEQVRQDKLASLPPLDEILSLHDFEALAKETMSDKAWAYYSSGADDEITMVCPRGALASYLKLISVCRGRTTQHSIGK